MRFPIRPWIFNRNDHRLMRCSLILMIGVLMIGKMKPTSTSTSIQTLTGIGHQKPQSKDKTPPTKTTTRAVSLTPITLLLRVLRLHQGKMEHRRYSELLLHAFFFRLECSLLKWTGDMHEARSRRRHTGIHGCQHEGKVDIKRGGDYSSLYFRYRFWGMGPVK